MKTLECVNYVRINDGPMLSEAELGAEKFAEIMRKINIRGMEAIGFRELKKVVKK